MKQTIESYPISTSRICVFSTARCFHHEIWRHGEVQVWCFNLSKSRIWNSFIVPWRKFDPPKNVGEIQIFISIRTFWFLKKTGLASMIFFLCFLWDLCRCVCIPQWYCCCSERWFYNLLLPDIHSFVSGPWSSFMTSRTFAAHNITGNF